MAYIAPFGTYTSLCAIKESGGSLLTVDYELRTILHYFALYESLVGPYLHVEDGLQTPLSLEKVKRVILGGFS